jgi:hypothetical protein
VGLLVNTQSVGLFARYPKDPRYKKKRFRAKKKIFENISVLPNFVTIFVVEQPRMWSHQSLSCVTEVSGSFDPTPLGC